MGKRRKYSKEFKEEAVQMVSVPGVTLRQVASDLGIGEGVLGRWKRELSAHGKKAFIGKGYARAEENLGRICRVSWRGAVQLLSGAV